MINDKPYIEVSSDENSCWEGWDNIIPELKQKIKSLDQKKIVICVECYQGTYADFNLKKLKNGIAPNVTVRARDVYKEESEIRQLIANETENDTTSKISKLTIEDYIDQNKAKALVNNIDFIEEGVILIHGIGSHLIWPADIIIYSDMSRYEILQRFRRNEIPNLGLDNDEDAFEVNHNWSFFIDWNICDKLKKQMLLKCHYFLETNNWLKPKLADGNVVRNGLVAATQQPIFMAKFFDPELWDSVKQENKKEEHFWTFDCDFEQNNILLKIGNFLFETPAINILFYEPKELLGEAVFQTYGTNVPVKFNFLDNLNDKKHLKLSFYPDATYIKEKFGFDLHQDDNYYVMENGKAAKILTGLKKGINEEAFSNSLIDKTAQKKLALQFNETKLKKHDHLFIPSNVIHSNVQDAIILHIYGGADFFERTIYNNDSKVAQKEALSYQDIIKTDALNKATLTSIANTQVSTEKSKESETLDPVGNSTLNIERIWFDQKITINTNNSIHVFNLIEGDEVTVESPKGDFNPVRVHYSETFIIPARVSEITLKPVKGTKFGILKVGSKLSK